MLANQSQSSQPPAVPSHMHCSHEVVCGLIETASAALFSHFPKAAGDTLDVEMVLDALRVFRPKVAEIGMLDGVLHIVHARWDEAMHTLREVVALAPEFDYAKAMLAYCLASKGTDDWRQWAAEAVEGGASRETRSLIRALEAREDLLFAKMDYRGGDFVVPESCRALAEENAAEDKAAAASGTQGAADAADVPAPQFGYLRA
jgi:type III secretion protein HrpB1